MPSVPITTPAGPSSERATGDIPSVLIRRTFLALGLLFGLCYTFIVPPMQGPDEFAHWFRAYGISEGYCIAPVQTPIPVSAFQLAGHFPINMNGWRRVDQSYVWKFLHDPLEPAKQVQVHDEAANKYNCLPYLPVALGIGVGRVFNQSAEIIFFLGRLGNLIAYLAIIYLALAQLPGYEFPMLALALMPMTLSQGASSSWDGLVFAVGFFLTAYIFKLAFDPAIEHLDRRHYAILCLTIVFASLCKSDGWLVLLVLIVPASKFRDSRRKAMVVAGLIVFSVAVLSGWNLINHENMSIWVERVKNRNVFVSDNAAFVTSHPLIFAQTVVRTVVDNRFGFIEQFVGKLGWLSVSLPHWSIWMYAALLVLVAFTDAAGFHPNSRQRAVFLSILLIAGASIFIGIWCAEATREYKDIVLHKGGYVPSVQGRYFIPFAIPLLLIFSEGRRLMSKKWLLAISTVTILIVNTAAVQAARVAYYRIGDTSKDTDKTAAEVDFEELGPPFAITAPQVSGAWVADGYFKGSDGPGAPPAGGPVYGSYPDANTGTIRLGPFQLDGATDVVIPVVTGPDTRNLSVMVRDAESKEVLAELAPPAHRQNWWAWNPRIPAGYPIAVEIVAEDKGPAWGQWMAIGWPHAQRRAEVSMVDVGALLPDRKPEISGGWVPNGYFTGSGGPGVLPAGGPVYGSFPDASTGSIRLGPFSLEPNEHIEIPMVTGPDTHGLTISIRDVVSKATLTDLIPPPTRQNWWVWRPDLPAETKLNLEVVAEDRGSGWGQWMALGWPHSQRPAEMPLSDLGARLPGGKTEISGSFVPDGYFKGGGGPDVPPVDGGVYGSYPDANTGTLRLGPFPLEANERIAIPLVTGPDTHHLSVVLRDAATKQILSRLSPLPMRQTWWAWRPDLPSGRKLNVEIVAEDKGQGWGQWLGIGWPHSEHPADIAFSDLGPKLPDVKPEIAGAWVPDGYFKGDKLTAPRSEGPVLGTFPDAGTGTLRLGPFTIGASARIAIPLITGPDNRGLSLVVRDTVSKQILARLTPPPLRQTWWIWRPELPAGKELTVEVLAEDKGSGWGEWLAIAWPHTMRR